MGQLEILPSVELEPWLAERGDQLWQVWVELRIDGESPSVHPGCIGCLRGLADLLAHGSGRYELLNCACGQRGCGGYYEGVVVSSGPGDQMTWTDLDQPEKPPVQLDTVQVREAVTACIEELRPRVDALKFQQIEFRCWDDAELF